jgi:glycerol-3-phosphate dehydrogenase
VTGRYSTIKRFVFAIPYRDDFTLIGTTDRDYYGDLACVTATVEEITYLCAAVGDYLATPVKPDDVVWS